MLLKLKGSLGDHACYTGLPSAYFHYFNEKLSIESQYLELWKNNPYIHPYKSSINEGYTLNFEQTDKDWLIYKPIRVFYEMTGIIADRNYVQPKLYVVSSNSLNLLGLKKLVVCDQAGWPSKRNYKHLNNLISKIAEIRKVHTILLRNPDYIDCTGQIFSKELEIYDDKISPTLEEAITIIRDCNLFIGYDSAYAHLAGALNIPYVLLCGSTPPINVAHNSCIYALDICRHCHRELCSIKCLDNSPDWNVDIVIKCLSYL